SRRMTANPPRDLISTCAHPTHPRRCLMADLGDGAAVEVQGSGSRPYTLKNVAGVYSCSCPAWRHQSLPIERRTCKHLRRLRGDTAEAARVGGQMPACDAATAATVIAPPLLLA